LIQSPTTFKSSFNLEIPSQARNDENKSGITNYRHSELDSESYNFQSSFNLEIPSQARNDESRSGITNYRHSELDSESYNFSKQF